MINPVWGCELRHTNSDQRAGSIFQHLAGGSKYHLPYQRNIEQNHGYLYSLDKSLYISCIMCFFYTSFLHLKGKSSHIKNGPKNAQIGTLLKLT